VGSGRELYARPGTAALALVAYSPATGRLALARLDGRENAIDLAGIAADWPTWWLGCSLPSAPSPGPEHLERQSGGRAAARGGQAALRGAVSSPTFPATEPVGAELRLRGTLEERAAPGVRCRSRRPRAHRQRVALEADRRPAEVGRDGDVGR